MSRTYYGDDVEEFIFGEGTTFDEACSKEACKKEACKKEACKKEGCKKEGCDGEDMGDEYDEIEESEIEVTSEEMNAFGVIECVDDPEVACYRIALENEMNYNTIMNAFMNKEFSVLESTGREMIYEAADVAKFFDTIMAYVKKFWGKVQGVFKKVMDRISEYVVFNKRFIDKYEGASMKTPEGANEFDGFNFADLTMDYMKIYDVVTKKIVDPKALHKYASADAVEQFVTSFNEDFKDAKDQMRGIACGTSSVKEEDFSKMLKERFYGSAEKVKVKLLPFDELISELKSAKAAKDGAKQSYKKAESAVKSMMSDVKAAKASVSKAKGKSNSAMRVAKCYTDALNACITIMSKTLSAQTRAILTKAKQDRAMAGYYVSNQPKGEKKTAKNEAAFEDLGIVLI